MAIRPIGVGAAAPRASRDDADRRGVTIRLGMLSGVTIAATIAMALDWQSPLRVVIVLVFLLFAPGLAFAEALGVRQALQQLAIAIGVSLAVETLAGIGLVYAGRFSPGRAFAIVVTLTLGAVAVAALRTIRGPLPLAFDRPSRSSA